MKEERKYSFDTQREKDAKIRQLFNRKIRSGYKVLYTFPREMEKKIRRFRSVAG